MKESCRQFLKEQFDGDMATVEEIYNEYVESAREKTGEMAAAVAAEEWELLDRIAHTVKGNALMAGDNDTAESAIALRGAAKLKDHAQADALVARIRELVAEL